jgi:UDP-N-acetylmuramoyl-L-alanyl-D-glutamate--2,6-diaminopimelate ligase
MKSKRLAELVPGIASDIKISGVSFDSRKVHAGDLFVAISGFKDDGAKYIATAFEAGAAAVLAAKGTAFNESSGRPVFFVEDTRRALAIASAHWFDSPAKSLQIWGVTGTKGKTSSAYLMEGILRSWKKSTALLGTVECRYPGFRKESVRTTMESLELHEFLSSAREAGASNVAMEVSSHALSLHRVWGVPFAGVLFTNLSEDHLDFYGDMETYFRAKQLLFAPPFSQGGTVKAVCIDGPYGARLEKELPGPWLTFGLRTGEFRAQNWESSAKGIWVEAKLPNLGFCRLESPLVGEFNIQNILGAAVLAAGCGVPLAAIQEGVRAVSVPGRLEPISTSLPFAVFVDFAHMGSALENVLQALRPLAKGRLRLVVGAGGDRDPARRVQLGSVAARLADHTVITSDNPRTEDPETILDAVEAAFRGAKPKGELLRITDRRLAIEKALEACEAGDVLCIAGKGHESGQTIGTRTLPFDDREEAAKILRKLENKRG